MKIKKKMVVEIETEEDNINLCDCQFLNNDMDYCKLFRMVLKIKKEFYTLRCGECKKIFKEA